MTRKFLEDMGLSKEQIDSILDEHSKNIGVLKGQLQTAETERDNARQQLSDANKTIGDFKAMNIDEIKQSADDWKAKFEKAEQDGQAALDKLRFDTALDRALSGAKAKNAKAVRALLDESKLKLNGETIDGLEDQLKALQADSAYLFEGDPQMVLSGGSDPVPTGGFGFRFTPIRSKPETK